MSEKILLGALSVVVLGIGAYYIFKNNVSKTNNDLKLDRKSIDGTLSFEDIVSWFKGLNLERGKDIPFICLADKFQDLIKEKFNLNVEKTESPFDTLNANDKKARLVLGVYNEKSNALSHLTLLESDQLDEKTLQVLGDESMVLLN